MNITDKDKQGLIIAQALKEIDHARRYKQGKVKNWQKNEQLYYSKKVLAEDSRANVDLGRMQEFVHTLQSKIKTPLVFKFLKKKNSQLKRVKRLNALREVDSQKGFWDIKDIAGKKQAIIYGRTVYSYYADSINNEYKSYLKGVDVYDFLIDPAAGGIDIEEGFYMGDYGVVVTRKEMEDGIKGKKSKFIKSQVEVILQGAGNNTAMPQEEQNKQNRMFAQNTNTQKELLSQDKFKFWRWFTTFQGERYYLLLQDRSSAAIRIEPLTDIFPATPDFPLGPWPYWTWAAFIDLTEFWTPSYCDYVREIFMTQNSNINQMLDNAEEFNKPMVAVNTGAIKNMSELKYRRGGRIRITGDTQIDKALQYLRPPIIDTPLKVFDALEKIQEKASGVLAQAKGASQEDGTLGIYDGNKQEMADRFGLLNISYSFGYSRFAKLYELGVREHMTKRIAISMTGPDGIETEKINKHDIFKKNEDFTVKVESSDAETQASLKTQELKLKFLSDTETGQNQQGAPKIMNPKKSFELKARIAGFSEDDIKELVDLSEFGNEELMSECDRDIESLEDGEVILPNQAANNAYKQRMVDWLADHQEDMLDKPELVEKFFVYIRSLDPIIMRNEQRALIVSQINQINTMPPTPNGTSAAPVSQPPVPSGQPINPGQNQ